MMVCTGRCLACDKPISKIWLKPYCDSECERLYQENKLKEAEDERG